MATVATEERTPERPAHALVMFNEQLQSRLPEFKNALPVHIPPERFARVALTAVQMNPELATVDRRSLMNALQKCASDGLLPDGRQAAIVPFNDNNSRSPTYRQQVAVYIPMVAGLLARFRNSGQFKAISCNVVRDGETFRHWVDEQGEHLLHEPGDNESAKIVKAYAMALTKDGGVAIRVMSTAAVDKRRSVSRAKDGPMWREWYGEAAQKTVLRNLMKLLPSSSDDIDRIIARDEAIDFETAPPLPELTTERRERVGLASQLESFGGAEPAAAESTEPEETPKSAPSIQPSQDESLEQARALGRKHRADGVQRRALPPEYRDKEREAEAEAWREGWDHPIGGSNE